ncbi:hypothetical protein C8Q74DRAFT_934848 [Fomes fomentarius]|nr:hypothetical protein C8Q74DRAFT_934848 [Fomes fomentarius]
MTVLVSLDGNLRGLPCTGGMVDRIPHILHISTRLGPALVHQAMPPFAKSNILVGNPPPSTLLPSLPALDDTYGALLLGCFAGLISYGVLIHQAYRYVRVYADDHLVNKCFVLCVVVLDTVHNIVCMHACYAYLVTNYFKPLALLRGICKKHRILVTCSVLLALTTFGFAITGTVIAFEFHAFSQYKRFYWIDSAACGAAIASDCLTASVLIITLRRSRTGIFNTLALVFALARPDTMIWISLEVIAIRSYTNSVLAVLNSRQSLKDARGNSGPLELQLELQSVPNTHASSQDLRRSRDITKKQNDRTWESDMGQAE